MDTFLSLFLGFVFLATGAGLISIAYRAASGSLSRNAVAGIRISSTMASDEAWAAGHQAAFWPSAFGAGQMMFAGLILLFVPSIETSMLITLVAAGVLVASMAVATFMANQAARRATADGTSTPGTGST